MPRYVPAGGCGFTLTGALHINHFWSKGLTIKTYSQILNKKYLTLLLQCITNYLTAYYEKNFSEFTTSKRSSRLHDPRSEKSKL